MPNYKGRRKGTRRIVIWSQGKPLEWIIEGNKADGAAFEARQRLELQNSRLTTRTAPLFSDFCLHQYTPYAELNLKKSTWQNSRKYQLATLIEFFGGQKLTEISTDEIESFKRVRRSKKIEASSVNNELRLLGTVLNWAAETGYPCAKPKIIKLKQRERRVKAWTVAELQRLFAEARATKPWLVTMLIFLVNTGCRKGEAIAAEWDWIDFEAGMVRIPTNAYWQPKNGKPREVPMSDAVRASLSGERLSDRWVFPKLTRDRYEAFPKDLFLEIRRGAKLTGGPHTLRHTFASLFLQAQPDLFLLGKILGHSTQRVTELYTHLLPDHLSRARNAVNLTPTLQTMATTMAKQSKRSKTLLKTATRP